MNACEGSTHVGLFCGSPATDGPKGPIVTKSNQAVVQLTSDYSDPAPGFWAYFTAIGRQIRNFTSLVIVTTYCFVQIMMNVQPTMVDAHNFVTTTLVDIIALVAQDMSFSLTANSAKVSCN